MTSDPDLLLTDGVRLDGKTFAGGLARAVADRHRPAVSPITLDTRRGVYVPRWSSGKDDTVYICPENVDFNALRESLYKTDFGYTFSEQDPQPWTTVVGERWLPEWNGADATDDATDAISSSSPLLVSCRAAFGCRERLNRSIVILPVDETSRLNSSGGGNSTTADRKILLKKIGRAHGRTVYALVEKGCRQSARDIGYVITMKQSERLKPPQLHVVRDAEARIFCILIGDYATKRFTSLTKEEVYNSFSHYEGRIAKQSSHKASY